MPFPQGSGVPGSRAHHGKRQDRASATGQTSKSETTRHVLRLGSPITAPRIVSRGLKATRPFPEGSGLLGSRANRGICQDCASTTGQTSKSETPPSLPAMRLAYHSPKDLLPRAKAILRSAWTTHVGAWASHRRDQVASVTGAGRQAAHRTPRSSPKKFSRRDPRDRSQKTLIKKLFVFARIVRALASGSYSK